MDSISYERKKMIFLNKIVKNIFYNHLYFLLFLTFITLILYRSTISTDLILSYDDNVLLGSLAKIKSLPHYIESIINGNILDIQPIRDLSYFLDFKIKNFIPGYSFHLTNVVIWIAICHLVRKIFSLSSSNYYLIGLLTLIYATSPISANSVAWIAGRKHLLSTLFILCSTYFTIKNQQKSSTRNIFYITLFYFLSCFSQPINSLWIMWLIYFLYSNKKLKKSRYLLITTGTISFISIAVNFYYYKFIYANNVTSMSKFMNYKTLDLGEPLLALGRYFFQCLYPFAALPTTHYPGSWQNLLGLALLILFIIFCFKFLKEKRRSLTSAILYFAFPLILVTLNMTNIFSSDTYLLNSSIGFYWCCLIIFQDNKRSHFISYMLAFYSIALMLYSYQYIQIFNNENELWLYSQAKEPAPQSTVIASSILTKQKKFHESYLLIEEIQDRWPNQPYLPQLIAENIFANPQIKNETKIKVLLEITPPMPSTYFYLSLLYAHDNETKKLEGVLFKIFEGPEKFNMEFRGNEEKIAAIFLYTCKHFQLKECDQHLNNFKARSLYKGWNLKLLDDYYESLRAQPTYQISI